LEKALPLALKAVDLSNTNLVCALTLAEIYSRLGHRQKAVESLENGFQQHPKADSALPCNQLAWLYVTGPKERRAPEKALPLALKAVELSKTNQAELNTLGVVYYRLGQFTNAIEVFQRNIQKESGPVTACDRLFLAMSHQRLGETNKAEACYAKATKWLNENPAQEDQEMKEFRAEAEEVFGKQKGK
jgi:tetratricopeptide (TPR) repeat protein